MESPEGALKGEWAQVLSRREAQVALCIAEGCTNAIIGQRLGIRTRTVAAHVASAKVKLRVKNRAHLAAVVMLACARGAPAVLGGLLRLQSQDAN